MKRFTLLMLAFVGSIAMQAQNPVPCSQSQPTDDFNGGASVIDGEANGGQTVANDFIVTAGTTVFTVESISASLLTPDNIDLASVDVSFYDNTTDSNGGNVPGNQIGTTLTIVPTSQNITLSTTLVDGTPVALREVILDLPTPQPFNGSGTSDDVIYWVSMVANPSTATGLLGWENINSNDVAVIGSPLAFIQSGGSWTSSQNQDGSFSDGVFTISGMCMGDPLSTEDQNSATFEVSLFPNPVVDVVNITLPSSVELESATIHNLLGKQTQVNLGENNSIDMSQMAAGVYILKLETNQGSLTKKIIKQ